MVGPVGPDELSLPHPRLPGGPAVLSLAPGGSGSVALSARLPVNIFPASRSLAQAPSEKTFQIERKNYWPLIFTCAGCWSPRLTRSVRVFWPTQGSHCHPRRPPRRPRPLCAGRCRTAPSCSHRRARTQPAGIDLCLETWRWRGEGSVPLESGECLPE